MAIMEYFASHPEELDGNLVHVAECDEEDNSHGIISAISVLNDWKSRYKLNYVAAINADYSIPNDQDGESRNVYLGTIESSFLHFTFMEKKLTSAKPLAAPIQIRLWRKLPVR